MRYRASRDFLNDSARSSLPQYRQANLLVVDAGLRGRRTAFLLLGCRAAFGLTATVLFVAGTVGSLAAAVAAEYSHRHGDIR